MANIGMMEGAYFVGRVELLNWLNDLLKLDYTKVEQTCTGAAHLQIMDAIYPGKVPLSKVNFNAKHEYEYVNNYKVLQSVFDKLGLEKYIDVQKMIKGRYQDNLEFLQWIKRYFDLNYSGGEYPAVERRNQKGGATTTAVKKPTATTTAVKEPVKKVASEPKEPVKKPVATTTKTTTTTATAQRTSVGGKAPAKSTPKSSEKEDDEKSRTISEMKVTIEGLEKERDFFFSRLREIEILCQSAPEPKGELVESIFKVLYSDPEGGEAKTEQTEEEEQVQEEEVQQDEESF